MILMEQPTASAVSPLETWPSNMDRTTAALFLAVLIKSHPEGRYPEPYCFKSLDIMKRKNGLPHLKFNGFHGPISYERDQLHKWASARLRKGRYALDPGLIAVRLPFPRTQPSAAVRATAG